MAHGKRARMGGILIGVGMGGFVDGILLHQILRIHYVRQVPEYTAYNLTFLAVGGLLFLLIGWLLSRQRSTSKVGS